MARLRYLLNCPTGFEEVVAEAIVADVPGISVRSVEAGFLVIASERPVQGALRHLPYLSSCLYLLASTPTKGLDRACLELAAALGGSPRHLPPLPGRSFRLRVGSAGKLVSVGKPAQQRLVSTFQNWSGLRPDPRRAPVELWVVQRREDNRVHLALRLDTNRPGRTAPGALRSDLTAAFVRVVTPRSSERVLDLFAGSGAIPAARARYPASSNLAAEHDPHLIKQLRRRQASGDFGRTGRVVALDVLDPLQLDKAVPAGSVDTVLTDPPWGLYEQRDPAAESTFALALWRSIDHCLSPAGRAVLLLSNPSLVPGLRPSCLLPQREFPVLVNGKKAQVLVVARPGQAAGASGQPGAEGQSHSPEGKPAAARTAKSAPARSGTRITPPDRFASTRQAPKARRSSR